MNGADTPHGMLPDRDAARHELHAQVSSSARELRKRAERLLHEQGGDVDPTLRNLSDLVHELQVHQIELELQNEELRRAQAELEASRERYVDLFDFAPVGYLTTNAGNTVLDANLTATEQLGADRASLIGMPLTRFIVRDDQDVFYLCRKQLLESELAQSCLLRIADSDGAMSWVQLELTLEWSVENDEPTCRVTLSDVTALKEKEAALRESEARFRGFFDHETNYCFLVDPGGGILDANPAALAALGHRSRDELVGRSVLESVYAPGSRERLGRLLHERRRADTAGPEELRIIGAGAEERTIILNVAAVRDDDGSLRHTIHIQTDITDLRRVEAELRRTTAQLDRSRHSVVVAMAELVGLRDSFTAEHQRRVAAVAEQLAAELGLDDEVRSGLTLAAEVHDIGKLAVPVEILTKPTPLTTTDRGLIQQHPRIGQEILAPIDFDRPIAAIVHQHHERLDGSGYPRGLKEDDILLEARVLAVADTLEAMASDRPYRPAHSLDEAFAELRDGAGRLYDPAVVTAAADTRDRIVELLNRR